MADRGDEARRAQELREAASLTGATTKKRKRGSEDDEKEARPRPEEKEQTQTSSLLYVTDLPPRVGGTLFGTESGLAAIAEVKPGLATPARAGREARTAVVAAIERALRTCLEREPLSRREIAEAVSDVWRLQWSNPVAARAFDENSLVAQSTIFLREQRPPGYVHPQWHTFGEHEYMAHFMDSDFFTLNIRSKFDKDGRTVYAPKVSGNVSAHADPHSSRGGLSDTLYYTFDRESKLFVPETRPYWEVPDREATKAVDAHLQVELIEAMIERAVTAAQADIVENTARRGSVIDVLPGSPIVTFRALQRRFERTCRERVFEKWRGLVWTHRIAFALLLENVWRLHAWEYHTVEQCLRNDLLSLIQNPLAYPWREGIQ